MTISLGFGGTFKHIALMSIIQSILNKLDKGEYAADNFGDLKMVFSTLNHNIWIDKLKLHGVTGVTKE